jgi:uroporphyrinogen-III synthase
VPDVDSQAVASLLDQWRTDPFKIVIFQTGVGTRALFQATDAQGLTGELLRHLISSVVVVRGPKPVGELNLREVRIDIRAATPFTTETVLAATSEIPVRGEREIATYRWALPADIQPLNRLLDALAHSSVDAVVFTSAVQIHNLYAVAEKTGRASELAQQLNRSVIASIGPVCSRALREHGVTPSFEADPPKLGPLVAGLEQALSVPRRH